MKKLVKLAVLAMITAFMGSSVLAATCEVQYTRTACPGKEKISYKKCKGKKSCSKFKEADTVGQCRAKATKSCGNKRYSITKSKVINAIYDGKQITTESGKADFCLEYANVSTEFNQCDK